MIISAKARRDVKVAGGANLLAGSGAIIEKLPLNASAISWEVFLGWLSSIIDFVVEKF